MGGNQQCVQFPLLYREYRRRAGRAGRIGNQWFQRFRRFQDTLITMSRHGRTPQALRLGWTQARTQELREMLLPWQVMPSSFASSSKTDDDGDEDMGFDVFENQQ